MKALIMKIKELPGNIRGINWVCKKCGYIGLTAYEYCPRCGAKYQ